MNTYNSNATYYNQYQKEQVVNEVKRSKIYIFFAFALALTGIIAFSIPYLYESALENNNIRLYNLLLTLSFVGSFIVLLPISIYMSVSVSRNRESKSPILMGILFAIYAAFLGLMIGTILYAVMQSGGIETIRLVSYAFLITAGVFLLCGVIGTLSKDMSPAISIVSSLSIGAIGLLILNIFLQSSLVSWVLSFAFLLFILVITAYDFHMINRIAGRSSFGNPTITALYCAFSIYTDFIVIFIRVLYFLLLLVGNRK